MKKTKYCKQCKKEFITYKDGDYCSITCYHAKRWGSGKCKVCGEPSKTRYCSDKCRNDYWNKNEYQLLKKKRFWERKLEVIKKLGGKCKICGLDDIRVLDINHIDRDKKDKHKNYSWLKRLQNWEGDLDNIEILCANCHRKHTWEQMGYGKY